MSAYGFNGWDVFERYFGHLFDRDPDRVLEVGTTVVDVALLVEMERPPWWREIEAERKALERERRAA